MLRGFVVVVVVGGGAYILPHPGPGRSGGAGGEGTPSGVPTAVAERPTGPPDSLRTRKEQSGFCRRTGSVEVLGGVNAVKGSAEVAGRGCGTLFKRF